MDNYLYVGDLSSRELRALERLIFAIRGLSEDSLEIIAEDVEKFAAGAAEHGHLDVLDKSAEEWLIELQKELTDARWYLRMISRHRKRMPVAATG